MKITLLNLQTSWYRLLKFWSRSEKEGHGKKEKIAYLALKEAQMTIYILLLGSANPLQCFSHLLPEGGKHGGSET